MQTIIEPSDNADHSDAYDLFPGLRALGLSSEESALCRQGYLSRDQRGRKKAFLATTVRQHKRLRTVFIGSDDEQVLRVRTELTRLQASRQMDLAAQSGGSSRSVQHCGRKQRRGWHPPARTWPALSRR